MAHNSTTPGAPAVAISAPTARLLYLILAAAVFLADRITKMWVEASLALHEARPVIPGFFDLVHARNTGIAFGLFADSPSPLKTLVLILLSAVALVGVVYLLWRGEPAGWKQHAGLALILGGAMGNLFDRVRQGSVVDFLDFFVGSYHWPAFNVADSAIVIGGGLLLLEVARSRKAQGA